MTALWYANAALNIATDVAVVVLPLYVLRDLRMVSLRQRIAINIVFLVGAVYVVPFDPNSFRTNEFSSVPV